jgi:histidine triad (HIT) family protein
MVKEDCIFCRMAGGLIPAVKVYENEAVLAFLDIGPVSDGHTLVIPKEHFEKLHDCPAHVLGRICSVLGKIGIAAASAMGADGYNVLCNNGRAAGQLVEHVHFHVIPRKGGDAVFNRWPSYKYPAGRMEEIAAQIRKKL